MAECLYDRGYIVNYTEGDSSLHRNQVSYNSTIYDIYHIIKEDETLYSIARKYYKASSLWFLIADVNPDITDILSLTPGDTILIPSLNIINSTYAEFQ